MIRIAITGPEATGKSTLSSSLAAHFDTVWCPEYSREYFANRFYDYTLSDVISINLGQINRISRLDEKYKDKKALFYDTEAIVNRVWAEDKFGFCPSEIMKTALKPAFDLYLLCYPDIEWEEDPLREDRNNRLSLFEKYSEILSAIGAAVFVVKGSGPERTKKVIDYIRGLYPELK